MRLRPHNVSRNATLQLLLWLTLNGLLASTAQGRGSHKDVFTVDGSQPSESKNDDNHTQSASDGGPDFDSTSADGERMEGIFAEELTAATYVKGGTSRMYDTVGIGEPMLDTVARMNLAGEALSKIWKSKITKEVSNFSRNEQVYFTLKPNVKSAPAKRVRQVGYEAGEPHYDFDVARVGGLEVERLVDIHDNEFVISYPRTGTLELQQDLRLISDLVIIIMSASVGAAIFTMMRQPLIIGYIVAGSCVGPGGLGLVLELVQVETLAQLGVVFILFALGVELSISKLRRVQGVALLGGIIEIFLMMLICGVFSDFTGAPSTEGIFVGAFISMSSTAVVIKCLVDRCALQSLDSQIVVGTLILQDCTVGFLFALLPVLSGSRGSGEAVMSFVRVIAMMFLFFIMAVAIRPLVAQILNNVYAYNENLYKMVVIAFCLCVSWTSDHLGLSIELGAFFAGVMVSTTPVAEETQNHINPVRNIFGALFLSSIGMIINPFFLWVHFDVLICTLMIIILFKCSVIALVVRAFGFSTRISITVGISMAQIGEFSFVLLSRASNLGLVKHKFYLLLLGITAISLFTSPIILRYSPYLMSRLPRP